VDSLKACLGSLKSELANPPVLGQTDPADHDVVLWSAGTGRCRTSPSTPTSAD
jgi:hypothetical protein